MLSLWHASCVLDYELLCTSVSAISNTCIRKMMYRHCFTNADRKASLLLLGLPVGTETLFNLAAIWLQVAQSLTSTS